MAPAPPRAGRAGIVLVTVVVAAVWPAQWAVRAGDLTAILGIGRTGPSAGLVVAELDDAVVFANKGHDGQQFYVVARHPFDPEAGAPWLDNPSYRYRRILFPALAGRLAPAGGRNLVAALLAVSLAGVGLGAWALSRLRDAPRWLPLLVAVTPGVVAALLLSLSDALATGLVLVAFVAAREQRWPLTLLTLMLAGLTRETTLLAALAIAFAPGLSGRWRAAIVTLPVATLSAWMASVSLALGEDPGGGATQQFALPFAGWLSSGDDAGGLLIGVLSAALLIAGVVRAGFWRPVQVYLVLLLVLDAMLADDVTSSWIDASRVVAPGVPLAAWALFRTTAAPEPSRAPTLAVSGA
jgi:hypothetical protein